MAVSSSTDVVSTSLTVSHSVTQVYSCSWKVVKHLLVFSWALPAWVRIPFLSFLFFLCLLSTCLMNWDEIRSYRFGCAGVFASRWTEVSPNRKAPSHGDLRCPRIVIKRLHYDMAICLPKSIAGEEAAARSHVRPVMGHQNKLQKRPSTDPCLGIYSNATQDAKRHKKVLELQVQSRHFF